MSADDLDLMLEALAEESREEQEALDRTHGQHILHIAADRKGTEDPLADTLRRAYQAEADDE